MIVGLIQYEDRRSETRRKRFSIRLNQRCEAMGTGVSESPATRKADRHRVSSLTATYFDGPRRRRGVKQCHYHSEGAVTPLRDAG